MLFSLKIKIFILAFLLGGGLLAGFSYYFYKKGKDEAQFRQTINSLENEIKVYKSYEKIDKDTPFNSSKRESLDWLWTKAGRD